MKASVFVSFFVASVLTFVTGHAKVERQRQEVRFFRIVERLWVIPENSSYIPDASWLGLLLSFQEGFSFDTRLIGAYSLTEYYNSGGFSRVKSTTLTIDSYGNVTIYEPQVYLSGSGIGMRSDSPPTILLQFKIFTKLGKIYLEHHQTKQREVVFGYTVDANAMVWIGEDGERIIWKR